jgi:hypothetical protein
MLSRAAPASHGFAALKEKQCAIRSGFPEALGLRVHRSLSWLGRAEAETDDHDVRFVLLWVGFNAAYAGELGEDFGSERSAIETYFDGLVQLDQTSRIYHAVWFRFPHEIRLLLANKYVFSPFWKHNNGIEGYDDWEERLTRSGLVVADRDRATGYVQDPSGCLRPALCPPKPADPWWRYLEQCGEPKPGTRRRCRAWNAAARLH